MSAMFRDDDAVAISGHNIRSLRELLSAHGGLVTLEKVPHGGYVRRYSFEALVSIAIIAEIKRSTSLNLKQAAIFVRDHRHGTEQYLVIYMSSCATVQIDCGQIGAWVLGAVKSAA